MEFDLSVVLGQVILYLGAIGGLAAAVTLAVEHIKALGFQTLKEQSSDTTYLWVIYATRFVLTLFGYFYIWGGIATIRELLPIFAPVPDHGLTIITILLIVAGEEVIHNLYDRMVLAKEAYSSAVNELENAGNTSYNTRDDIDALG